MGTLKPTLWLRLPWENVLGLRCDFTRSTVYQQIFGLGRVEARQISTGVERGPPEADGPPFVAKIISPSRGERK
jgi:hypothetical protein